MHSEVFSAVKNLENVGASYSYLVQGIQKKKKKTAGFSAVSFNLTRRGANQAACLIAKHIQYGNREKVWPEDTPPCIDPQICHDKAPCISA